jgi:uncharacterized protein (TIGR01777 family)
MRVAVTGATGAIGRRLVPVLEGAGHRVVAITRSAESAAGKLGSATDVRVADLYSSASLVPAIAGCDAIVHLAGEPIFGKRWSKRQRKAIYDSRIVTTQALVQAVHDVSPRPRTFLCQSAVGFYGPREPDEVLTEDVVDAEQFAPRDFLAWVCRDWEDAAREVERYGVRCVRTRTGLVLMRGEGALARLEGVFRKGLGGSIGSGRQVMSWIHERDLCRLFLFALERADVSGPLNATAPEPVSNKEFSKALARALHRPCFLRVPRLALRLQMGQVANVVVTGQRVIPKKALDLGFRFEYPTIDGAFAALYGDVRASSAAA